MNTKNYQLYLSGVISENQFMYRDYDNHFEILKQYSEELHSLVNKTQEMLQKSLYESNAISPEDKDQAESAISWFKNKIGDMKSYLEKSVHMSVKSLQKNADEAIASANRVMQIPEIASMLKKLNVEGQAKQDAAIISSDLKTKLTESILGSVGMIGGEVASFALKYGFKALKFFIFNVMDVLIRTAIKVLEWQKHDRYPINPLHFFITLLLGVTMPLFGLFSLPTKGGIPIPPQPLFLIPAGVFYLYFLIKAIYAHIHGSEYFSDKLPYDLAQGE